MLENKKNNNENPFIIVMVFAHNIISKRARQIQLVITLWTFHSRFVINVSIIVIIGNLIVKNTRYYSWKVLDFIEVELNRI